MIMKAFDFRNLPVDDCEITYSNLYNNIEFFVFFLLIWKDRIQLFKSNQYNNQAAEVVKLIRSFTFIADIKIIIQLNSSSELVWGIKLENLFKTNDANYRATKLNLNQRKIIPLKVQYQLCLYLLAIFPPSCQLGIKKFDNGKFCCLLLMMLTINRQQTFSKSIQFWFWFNYMFRHVFIFLESCQLFDLHFHI